MFAFLTELKIVNDLTKNLSRKNKQTKCFNRVNFSELQF